MRSIQVLGMALLLGLGGCTSKATHGLALADGGRNDASGDGAAVGDDAGDGADGAAVDSRADVSIEDPSDGPEDARGQSDGLVDVGPADAAAQRDGAPQTDAQTDGVTCSGQACCAELLACEGDAECSTCSMVNTTPACTVNGYWRAYYCCFLSQPGFAGCCTQALDCFADPQCAPCMSNPTSCNGSTNSHWICFNLCESGWAC